MYPQTPDSPEHLADYLINSDYYSMRVYRATVAELVRELRKDGIYAGAQLVRAAAALARDDAYMLACVKPLIRK